MWVKWREVYRYYKKKTLREKGDIVRYERFLLFPLCFHESLSIELWMVSTKILVINASNQRGFTVVYSSKVKEFVGNSFKFDENGRVLQNGSTVVKG